MVFISLPNYQGTGREEMVSSGSRAGLGWIFGKIFHQKGYQGLEQTTQKSG